MKPRQQRMLAVGLAVAGLAIAAALTLRAFEENMMFFIDISDVVKGEYPSDRNFRVGGLVVEGSVVRQTGELDIEFTLLCMLSANSTSSPIANAIRPIAARLAATTTMANPACA